MLPFALKAGSLIAFLFLVSGCGSIYVGTTSHTHVYGPAEVVSDDVEMGKAAWIARIVKQMNDPDAGVEPLEGFVWTDKGVPEGDEKQ